MPTRERASPLRYAGHGGYIILCIYAYIGVMHFCMDVSKGCLLAVGMYSPSGYLSPPIAFLIYCSIVNTSLAYLNVIRVRECLDAM